MKKKRNFLIALTLSIAVFGMCLPGKITLADTYGMAGSGTTADPYIVVSAEQLENVANVNSSASYKLGADIDLSSYSHGWNPIANGYYPFTGTFDGNGYKITNLSLGYLTSKTLYSDYGLFGMISGATIENVDVSVTIYTTGNNIGGLAGSVAANSHIVNCHTEGLIEGGSEIGGLAGSVADSSISECESDVAITYGVNYIGGLTGEVQNSTISNCAATGTLTITTSGGGGEVGGFVGDSLKSNISNSYATGNVTGQGYVGGFIGNSNQVNIINSYASGNVSSTGVNTGGFIGGIYDYTSGVSSVPCSAFYNCYALGNVSGTSGVGGFSGESTSQNSNPEAYDCYATGIVTGGSTTFDKDTTCGFVGDLSFDISWQYIYWNSANKAGYHIEPNSTSGQIIGTSMALASMQDQTFVDTLNAHKASSNCVDWVKGSSANGYFPALKGIGPDTTPPTGSYSLSKSTWTCKPVTITVTATDAGSGVASITLPNSTVVSAATATYTVTDNGTYNFVLADNAGNSCTYPVTVSNIDKAVSVTHDQTVAYTIDPNSSTLSGGTITLTNNDPHIGVAVYLNFLSTSGISAVAPDAVANWNTLNATQTASGMAIAVGVSNAADTDWYSVARGAPAYSTDLASPVLIGIIKPSSSVTLNVSAKYGLAWASQKTVTHSLALSYQACDTD